jgi:hypothetical protein
MKRRDLLRLTGVAATAGLAGCGSVGDGSEPSSEEHKQHLSQMAWPRIASQVDGWTETNRQAAYLGQTAGIDTYQKTILLENTAVREEIKAKTNGRFDQKLGQFFATHIDLEGLTTSLANESKIADEVAPQIQSRMKQAGINDVHSGEVTSPVPATDGETREFVGHYKTPAIEQTADIDGIGERTVRFPSMKLPVRGFATVWKIDSGVAFASGGVVPDDDYEGSSRTSITSEEGDGIDLVVEADMNIPFNRMRREVVKMAESVERGSTSS